MSQAPSPRHDTTEAQQVLRHGRVYAMASLASRAAGFLLIPLYTRFLSPEEYGVFGVIGVTSEVVGAALGLRLGVAMSRIYFDHRQERDRNEVVTTALLGMIGLVAASMLPLALASGPLTRVVLGADEHPSLMFLGVVGLLLNTIFSLGLGYLQIQQRSRTYAIFSVLRSVLFLSLTALLVAALGLGVRGALIGILLTNAVAVAALVVPLLVRLRPRFSRAKLLAMLGFSLPLLPGELAELLVRFVDRYLVVHLASLAAAGVYFLGSRFGNLLHAALIAPFSQIFVIRRLAAFGDGAADPEGPRVYTYFFMVAATGAVGLSILAPEIVAVLAPASYEGARRVAPLFALNELILSLIFIVELGIYYAKRPLRLTAATLSTLTVHVALNLVLIPILGILGAALGSCLSSALRVALTVYLGRRFAGPRPEWLRIGVILALAIAMGMAGQALEAVPGPVGVLLRIALIPSLPLLLVASPLFGSADRAILREALGTLPGMRGRGEPRH